MDQEDQTKKCSNSSGGGGGCGGIGSVGRSCKKPKQKKLPQRGLGVAQLEKIRIEEQQQKDSAAAAIILSPPSSLSPRKSSYPSSLPINPNFQHSNQSFSSIPFPSPSPATDLPSPNLIIRPPQPLQNNNGFEAAAGWSAISVPNKLWHSYEYNLEKETSGVDPGLAFRSNLSLPYESNDPIWPLPGLLPRTQQFQQPSSSLVNVSSGISSSSVLNFQMEPPSNQSFYGNYTPMWQEEDKMVGMKRTYPFSLDNPPGPSLNYKFPTLVAPIRSDESASCGNGGTYNFEAINPILREGPSCSTSNSKPNSKKISKENGVFNGDFLTLATSTCPSSEFKHPSDFLASHGCGLPDFDSLPYQRSEEDTIPQPGPSLLNQQRPLYNFFPPAKAQIGQATTTINNNSNGEVEEIVDLNLKL